MQATHPKHSVTNIWILGFASPPSRTQCDQYLCIIIYFLAMFRLFLSMFFLHFFHIYSGYVPLDTSRRSSVLSCSVCVLSMFRLSSGSFNNCPPGFTVQSYPGLEMLEYLVKKNMVTIYKCLLSVKEFS